MRAIGTTYFTYSIYRKLTRTHWIALGVSLVAASAVLVLQSFRYASSVPDLVQTGQFYWWDTLSMMLKSLAIWAVVLGVVFAIQLVNQPAFQYGRQFWVALTGGFLLGLLLPYLLVLWAGIWIYIPLGLLSLFIPNIIPYATLQFTWIVATYLVLIWIVIGMPPLLVGTFREGRWYFKFLVVLLFFQLLLDVLQALTSAMEIIIKNSLWLANNTAFVLAIFGSLVLTIVAVVWSLRQERLLTIVYVITGIYIASIVTGNFSDLVFHWGEIPSALLTFLAPLAYLQVAKWILRSDGTALAGLAAGFMGLLAGLFVDEVLHLRITGQGWISLLYGIVLILILGLSLGYLLGRRFTNLLVRKISFRPVIVRYLDIGLIAGIMAGMLAGSLLAR